MLTALLPTPALPVPAMPAPAAAATAMLTPAAAPTAMMAAAKPWFGVLQADPTQAASLTAANIKVVTVELGWDAFEPAQGQVNQAYLDHQRSKVVDWQRAGFEVILDTGLQYPPAWVFDLPGGTRFVNQFGVTWTGVLGSQIANAVFNTSVRAAEASYYSRLSTAFGGIDLAAIRVGGLLMGELSYPPATSGPGTLWMYDDSAQAGSPVRGWKPGDGTAADSREAVNYYLAKINDYARFLLQITSDSFPAARLHLMLPSWGLRPGQLDAIIAAGFGGQTTADVNGLLTSGLDWVNQVDLLVPYGTRGVAFTTWLDAPTYGPGPADLSPAEFLNTLTSPRQVGLAGENTGTPTMPALQLSIDRVKTLEMQGMLWMSAAGLLTDPTLLSTYGAASG